MADIVFSVAFDLVVSLGLQIIKTSICQLIKQHDFIVPD
jgi:hypothetical protein